MAVAHKVKKDWPTGLIELAPGVFAYVQSTGESGVSNAGLLGGDRSATLIDTLMVSSLNQPFMEAEEKVNLGPYREWREWPRVLVNVYRWDLERKNQLEAPLDIALYLKIIEELEKMKAE
jgi:hypothetical protein